MSGLAAQRNTKRPIRLRMCWGAFSRSASGDVAVLFGIMLATSLMVAGAAVDIARWLNARDLTLAAIDAAVLAGGRQLQIDGTDQGGAIAAAQLYYEQAIRSRLTLSSDTVRFAIADNGTAMIASGNAKIATPFMGLAGIAELPLFAASGADAPKATIASGSNAGLNFEIALMLDTSAAMAQTTASGNSKIADLEVAAKDLVNILVWDDQSTYKSRMALVPVAGDVRIPGAWLAKVQDPVSAPWQRVTVNRVRSLYFRSACVAERAGANNYTDAPAGPGNYLPNAYTVDGRCAQSSANNEVLAMTSDKAALLDRIGRLDLGSGTGGHIGTAWAYYLLSPNWGPVFPASAAPSAYFAASTQKIAILMSDGGYDTTHDSKGVPTNDTGGNANGLSSADQAVAICSNMKSSGIQVYTVGFDLQGRQAAMSTLQACASDASKFYDAADGIRLRAAFRDIALKVSSLRLTN